MWNNGYLSDDLIDRIFAESNIRPSLTFSNTLSFRGDFGRATLVLRFRVTCSQDYYGLDCDRFCQPRNNSGGHYYCDELNGDIVCLDGYAEPSTNCITSVCAGCDPNRGNCEIPGQCVCNECWNGSLCDQCSTDPGCDVVCICSPSPCENGGSCLSVERDGTYTYRCVCASGFTGENCTTNINDCEGANNCPENTADNTGLAVGLSVFAGVILVFCGIPCVICFIKSILRKRTPVTSSNRTTNTAPRETSSATAQLTTPYQCATSVIRESTRELFVFHQVPPKDLPAV